MSSSSASKDLARRVDEFFIKILKEKDKPVYYEDIRGYVSNAPEDVKAYIIRRCKGSELLRFFQIRRNYYDINRHAEVSLKKRQVSAAQVPGSPTEMSSSIDDGGGTSHQNNNENDIRKVQSCVKELVTVESKSESGQLLHRSSHKNSVPSKCVVNKVVSSSVGSTQCSHYSAGNHKSRSENSLTGDSGLIVLKKEPDPRKCVTLVHNASAINVNDSNQINVQKTKAKKIIEENFSPPNTAHSSTEPMRMDEHLPNVVEGGSTRKVQPEASESECSASADRSKNCTNAKEIMAACFCADVLCKQGPLPLESLKDMTKSSPEVLWCSKLKIGKFKKLLQNYPYLFVIKRSSQVSLCSGYEDKLKCLKEQVSPPGVEEQKLDKQSVEDFSGSSALSCEQESEISVRCVSEPTYITEKVVMTVDKPGNKEFADSSSPEQPSQMHGLSVNSSCASEENSYDIEKIAVPIQPDVDGHSLDQSCGFTTSSAPKHILITDDRYDNLTSALPTSSKSTDVQNNDKHAKFLVVWMAELLCLKIYEAQKTSEYKAVHYFVSELKGYFWKYVPLSYLKGKLGQAPPGVPDYINQRYPGKEFLGFFREHEEFTALQSHVTLSSSSRLDSFKMNSDDNSPSDPAKLWKAYYTKYFLILFRVIHDTVKKLLSFIRNKPNATLHRLCGHLNSLSSAEKCLLKLFEGQSISEKIQLFLSHFNIIFDVHEESVHACAGCDTLLVALWDHISICLIYSLVNDGHNTVSKLRETINSWFPQTQQSIPDLEDFIANNSSHFVVDSRSVVSIIPKDCGFTDPELSVEVLNLVKKNLQVRQCMHYTELLSVIKAHPLLLSNLICEMPVTLMYALKTDKTFVCKEGKVFLRELSEEPVFATVSDNSQLEAVDVTSCIDFTLEGDRVSAGVSKSYRKPKQLVVELQTSCSLNTVIDIHLKQARGDLEVCRGVNDEGNVHSNPESELLVALICFKIERNTLMSACLSIGKLELSHLNIPEFHRKTLMIEISELVTACNGKPKKFSEQGLLCFLYEKFRRKYSDLFCLSLTTVVDVRSRFLKFVSKLRRKKRYFTNKESDATTSQQFSANDVPAEILTVNKSLKPDSNTSQRCLANDVSVEILTANGSLKPDASTSQQQLAKGVSVEVVTVGGSLKPDASTSQRCLAKDVAVEMLTINDSLKQDASTSQQCLAKDVSVEMITVNGSLKPDASTSLRCLSNDGLVEVLTVNSSLKPDASTSQQCIEKDVSVEMLTVSGVKQDAGTSQRCLDNDVSVEMLTASDSLKPDACTSQEYLAKDVSVEMLTANANLKPDDSTSQQCSAKDVPVEMLTVNSSVKPVSQDEELSSCSEKLKKLYDNYIHSLAHSQEKCLLSETYSSRSLGEGNIYNKDSANGRYCFEKCTADHETSELLKESRSTLLEVQSLHRDICTENDVHSTDPENSEIRETSSGNVTSFKVPSLHSDISNLMKENAVSVIGRVVLVSNDVCMAQVIHSSDKQWIYFLSSVFTCVHHSFARLKIGERVHCLIPASEPTSKISLAYFVAPTCCWMDFASARECVKFASTGSNNLVSGESHLRQEAHQHAFEADNLLDQALPKLRSDNSPSRHVHPVLATGDNSAKFEKHRSSENTRNVSLQNCSMFIREKETFDGDYNGHSDSLVLSESLLHQEAHQHFFEADNSLRHPKFRSDSSPSRHILHPVTGNDSAKFEKHWSSENSDNASSENYPMFIKAKEIYNLDHNSHSDSLVSRESLLNQEAHQHVSEADNSPRLPKLQSDNNLSRHMLHPVLPATGDDSEKIEKNRSPEIIHNVSSENSSMYIKEKEEYDGDHNRHSDSLVSSESQLYQETQWHDFEADSYLRLPKLQSEVSRSSHTPHAVYAENITPKKSTKLDKCISNDHCVLHSDTADSAEYSCLHSSTPVGVDMMQDQVMCKLSPDDSSCQLSTESQSNSSQETNLVNITQHTCHEVRDASCQTISTGRIITADFFCE